MTETEIQHAMGHIQDARRSGNPAVQDLAAVCEYLLIELKKTHDHLYEKFGERP
jgi:hypothetical protein